MTIRTTATATESSKPESTSAPSGLESASAPSQPLKYFYVNETPNPRSKPTPDQDNIQGQMTNPDAGI